MENKIIGDVNLVSQGNQFKEQGSTHILDKPLIPEFERILSTSSMDYGFFVDFSKTYPSPDYPNNSELSVSNVTETILFDNLRLRSSDTTEDQHIMGSLSPQYNAVINEYLPWVYAVDSITNELTYSYTVKLYMKTPNFTFSVTTPGTFGFDTSKTTSSDSPPTPLNTNNTLYKMTITPSGGDMIVKGLGILYKQDLITS